MGQVYNITHDGAGNRLPSSQRSFISFKYNGKWIEDHHFVATIDGDALNRPFYGEMSYNISESDVLDGQYYWGYHFNKNTLELKLVTDRITESEFTEFKKWLKPGPAKEFIFAENPNRAIQVRVAEQPSFDGILPYEDKHTVKINGTIYNYSTTYYRGFLTVTFEADDPFWYSINNVLDGTLNSEKVKIIMEDNVPHTSMFNNTQPPIFTGDSLQNPEVINNEPRETIDLDDGTSHSGYLFYSGNAPADTIISFSLIPQFENYPTQENAPYWDVGSALVGHAYTWSADTETETYEAEIAETNPGYIIAPANKIAIEGTENNPYNIIQVGEKQFQFTTPSIYTGYNQALQIMNSFNHGDSFIEARAAIRDGINEYYSRMWALAMVNKLGEMPAYVNSQTSRLQGDFKDKYGQLMYNFLNTKANSSDTGFSVQPAIFSFNSKTGKATGTFKVRTLNPETEETIYATITENVGDMVYDSYLKLEDRNLLILAPLDDEITIGDDKGEVQLPSEEDDSNEEEETEPTSSDSDTEEEQQQEQETIPAIIVPDTNCTKITTDYPAGLQDFKIEYKYQYL